MAGSAQRKKRILIADDSEMNREILTDILGEVYEIVEAEDGEQAVAILQKENESIDMLLLDYVMPKMDGFDVLRAMNRQRWIEDIPVIMISAERSMTYVEQAFDLGVVDFIQRPFEALVVQRRVANTMLLYAKQKRLTGMVLEQIYDKERQSGVMIDILSHIVEFRNGESGLHVLHVRILTSLMLKRLMRITDKYPLTNEEVGCITMASALHDIGKIAIPEGILNKPGRLTDEEFAVMKTHSLIGAQMLQQLPTYQREPLVKAAYEISRWHHERYDGRGYPDGLKGDQIPIGAQIVALADVYDALTSERVYKKAFPHETAVEMILGGQCGTFNPLLMQCLRDIAPTLQAELAAAAEIGLSEFHIQALVEEIMQREELSGSSYPLHKLERERAKYNFYAAMVEEIWFEYTRTPSMLTLSPWGACLLGVDDVVVNPLKNGKLLSLVDGGALEALRSALDAATADQPTVQLDLTLNLPQGKRRMRMVARTLWDTQEPDRYSGVLGKLFDVDDAGSIS